MKAFDLGEEFHWGAASSAVQIEGAFNIDGKGFNIWDKFVQKRRKKMGNQTHYIANDFYHRFREDLLLLKLMNLDSFRFSISWSRILPKLNGPVNQLGIKFYHEVIDECLLLGIKPFVTLYHWDLPTYLEEIGGWTNREIIHHFNRFVSICIKEFGDKVEYWMPLNEPLVFTGAGYLLGVHAPGKKGFKNFLPAAYHAILANAEAGRTIKSLNSKLKVGSTFSLTPAFAASDKPKDINAGAKVNKILNHLFLDPYMGMPIPSNSIKMFERIHKYQKAEDQLSFDADFIGIQNYTQEVIKYNPFKPYIKADLVPAKKRNQPVCQMGWQIDPNSINHVFNQLKTYPNLPEVFITECGIALANENRLNQKVYDAERISYYEKVLSNVDKAMCEGMPIKGLFFWTLHDNFEWSKGYEPKFGLVEVNRTTQKRTLKRSAIWVRDFLEEKERKEDSASFLLSS